MRQFVSLRVCSCSFPTVEISAIVDEEHFFEIMPEFAKNIIIGKNKHIKISTSDSFVFVVRFR